MNLSHGAVNDGLGAYILQTKRALFRNSLEHVFLLFILNLGIYTFLKSVLPKALSSFLFIWNLVNQFFFYISFNWSEIMHLYRVFDYTWRISQHFADFINHFKSNIFVISILNMPHELKLKIDRHKISLNFGTVTRGVTKSKCYDENGKQIEKEIRL